MSFQFKQFTIEQDRCAMKVGTDAVLLGAWTPIPKNLFSILDIGAGTGVLALMLAQRTSAQQIDAIEIDDQAYEQCVDNFENSAWGESLFCYHAGLDEFLEEMEDESYDLIISNPPFYTDEYKSTSPSGVFRCIVLFSLSILTMKWSIKGTRISIPFFSISKSGCALLSLIR